MLLITIYVATLVHVLRGTKYKFVTSLLVMLLISYFGTLANVEGSYYLYVIYV